MHRVVGRVCAGRPFVERRTPLQLVMLPRADTVPPRVGQPGVEVWRDVDGRICALGIQDGAADHRLFVPRIGTFRFLRSSDIVEVQPLTSADENLVDDAYHRIALPLGLQWRGAEVMHASAVRFSAGVVAISGRSGAGKSTVAFALSRAGHALCADDAVAIETGTAGVIVPPLPFRMRLRRASADWFGEPSLLKGQERGTPWHLAEPAPLLAIFVLDRSQDDSPREPHVRRLTPVEAFHAILPHAYYLTLDDHDRNAALVSTYLEVADRVSVFSVRYTPSLHLVDGMVERIEAEVAGL